MFIEGEHGTTCRNYPNSDFQSYRECDDKYMRTKVDEVAPGLMPVWMTEDLSKTTTNPVVMTLKDSGITCLFLVLQLYHLLIDSQVCWKNFGMVSMNQTVHYHVKYS